MDNPANNISEEDIDTRLARYDEDVQEINPNRICQNNHLSKKSDKDKKEYYLISEEKKHNRVASDFSLPKLEISQEYRNIPSSVDYGYDQNIKGDSFSNTSENDPMSYAISKSYVLKKDHSSRLCNSPEAKLNRQERIYLEEKDYADEFFPMYSVPQNTKGTEKVKQFDCSYRRIVPDKDSEGVPYRQVPRIVSRGDVSKNSPHDFTSGSLLTNENKRKKFVKYVDNYEILSSDKNGARAKRSIRSSYDFYLDGKPIQHDTVRCEQSGVKKHVKKNASLGACKEHGTEGMDNVSDYSHHRDDVAYEDYRIYFKGEGSSKKNTLYEYSDGLKQSYKQDLNKNAKEKRFKEPNMNVNLKNVLKAGNHSQCNYDDDTEMNESFCEGIKRNHYQTNKIVQKQSDEHIFPDVTVRNYGNKIKQSSSEMFYNDKTSDPKHSKSRVLHYNDSASNIDVDFNTGRKSHVNVDSSKFSRVSNHSQCDYDDNIEMNTSFHRESGASALNDGIYFRNCGKKIKHDRCLRNKKAESDIWKRQSACLTKPLASSENFEMEEILNSRPVDTLTMRDARKIAPILLRCPVERNFSQRVVSFADENDGLFQNRRKCWARNCWSKTHHSHTVKNTKDLKKSEIRNAIVDSITSPQYGTMSKKKTCSQYISTWVKTFTSRFTYWDRIFKKIEGQFGTGVVSYFVFLKILILLNFLIFIIYLVSTILPYSIFTPLPHQIIKSAPNITVFTDEYLDQFKKPKDIPLSRKRVDLKNVSSMSVSDDLLSNLGSLLDHYAPDEILSVADYDKKNYTGEHRYRISLMCKERYGMEMSNRTKGSFSFFQDFLQGTGWLESTILFLGYYPDRDIAVFGLAYNLPVAFLTALIISFLLILVLTVQYSSDAIKENLLTRKSTYLTFSNILFCSWDYCIEDKKMADISHKSITFELRSNLTEEHRKNEISQWSSEKRTKVFMSRAIVNIIIIAALSGSFYLIYYVVNLQLEKQRQNALKGDGVYTLFIQFLPSLVITALNIFMPMVFNNLVKLEKYSTQTQVNIALIRIVFLRLASVFVLVASLHQQITCEPKDQCKAGLSDTCRSPICWETFVGQQLYKLVITDFLVYVCMFIGYDLFRDFIVQKCKCKVTEVIGRQEFDLPSQVLSLVYSQTLCWLGLFYSPLLSGITVLKFVIIFYMKKVVVLKHCDPAPVLYKASRNNSIFMTILMISLFIVTGIHGYSITSIEPSPGCSPFRQHVVMIHAISDAINDWSPNLAKFMSYIFSNFFIIPACVLLCLPMYYYWTVIAALRERTKILKAQIAVEGRDKQFLLNRLAEAAREITNE